VNPWLLGLVGVALLLLLKSSPSPTVVSIRGPVALVGDSIAVGLAGPLGALMRARGYQFFSDAEVGTNARQWRGRIDGALSRRPGTVFVNLGGNDTASAALTAEFAENMRAIVNKIRGAGALPILLEPPNRPSPSFAVIQQGLRSTGAIIFVPEPDQDRAADGVHFTPTGYREWAEAISAAVTP
jgi:lysophospholipase L1-like esterase